MMRIYPTPPQHPRRCLLSVPATSMKMISKALNSDADAVFLDLEDSVVPAALGEARSNAIKALTEMDWHGAGKSISIRVNGLDTEWMYQDIVTVLEKAGAHLDTVIIPKLGSRSDIYAVDVLVTQISRAMKFDKTVRLEGLIETASGIVNLSKIAAYNRHVGTDRLEALHFGAGDYAASVQIPTTSIGGAVGGYSADIWHYQLSAMVAACHANGLMPIDSAFGDFNNPEGYLEVARRARALGMVGKWAIHPSQIALAHEIFSPSSSEVAKAEAMIKALEDAESKGLGVARYEGQMIDAASARMAYTIIETAKTLKKRGG